MTQNALSIDVEDWFQAFDVLPRGSSYPSRVRLGLDRILTRLAHHGHRATFFVVGALARSQPELVRDIVDGGHRVGCHGLEHVRLREGGEQAFRRDLAEARALLQDQSGQPVLGYRAPWFSLDMDWGWPADSLLDLGFRYDSSLFPFFAFFYGSFRADPRPHVVRRREGAALWEVPPAPTRWGMLPLPSAGGIYTRILPVTLIKAIIGHWNRRGERALLYTHPWEFDPDQPRLEVSRIEKVIHYFRLKGWSEKFEELMGSFQFSSIEETFPQVAGGADER